MTKENVVAEVERALARLGTTDGDGDFVALGESWLRALVARVRVQALINEHNSEYIRVCDEERDALREQLAEREETGYRAGWNAGKACHTGIATLTEALAAWRASQKETP